MTIIFWDSYGVIVIDYLQKGKPITVEYYTALNDSLKAEIAEKRSYLHKNQYFTITMRRLTPQNFPWREILKSGLKH